MKALSTRIKQMAYEAGFSRCHIAGSEYLESEAPKLESWLSKGYQGDMSYMSRNFDLRLDPSLLVPGARSVIVLAMNYFQSIEQTTPYVSIYAAGKDYHKVIKKKLKNIISNLKLEIGDFSVRGFVDSAPVLERAWAVKSGLGFIGKNGNLIIPKMGSYFFLATLICDLELDYDAPFPTDHCGSCRRCIDACPTDAILENKVIDGSKCTSYYTIETKNEEWQVESPNLQQWLFGCDICQQVCPWNRFSSITPIDDFLARNIDNSNGQAMLQWTSDQWNSLTQKDFDEIFVGSPLKRKGYEGIMETLKYLSDEK